MRELEQTPLMWTGEMGPSGALRAFVHGSFDRLHSNNKSEV